MKLVTSLLMFITPAMVFANQSAERVTSILGFEFPDWTFEPFALLNVWQWIGIGGALTGAFLVRVLISYILKGIMKLASKTETEWDDKIVEAIRKPIGWAAGIGFLFICLYFLNFSKALDTRINSALNLLLGLISIWAAYRLVDVIVDFLKSLTAKTESQLDDQLMPIVGRGLRMTVVFFGVLLILQNFGINVFSVIAGLGVGGLAFALAAKDAAANFFGSMMIFLDKPFQVGDFVIIGGTMGTVEEIGFRSTRLRTLGTSVETIPNAKVANSNIENFSERTARRHSVDLHIKLDTPAAKVEQFIDGYRKLMEGEEKFMEGFRVGLDEIGESSLKLNAKFYLDTTSASEDLVIRQRFQLNLLKLADELGVELAMPGQMVHVEKMPS